VRAAPTFVTRTWGSTPLDPWIDLFCFAHRQRRIFGPLITVVGRTWAYCLAGDDQGHDWQRIEPLTPAQLRAGITPRRLVGDSTTTPTRETRSA
jgi:hypothetical protein